MIKCPRCQLQQENTDICKYCAFDMKRLKEASSDTVSYRKIAGILMLAFFVIITTGVHYFQKQGEGKKSPDASKALDIRTEMGIPQNISPEINQFIKGVSKGGGGFSGGGIIASLFFGVIGMGYFSYGKKRHQQGILYTGILLMSYSYFIEDTVMMALIGVEICFLPFILTLIFE